ncbi:hypothetical protein F0562_024500 [Nyssa sinensis]|uniref:Uncharacterized protein n=1 Tax=Nyssa sinensis TaxID=561372 RepID=A0A5J5BHF7_9ASTE|nr:hypothetical protein F0562_024500 [Nyssa sinensis]
MFSRTNFIFLENWIRKLVNKQPVLTSYRTMNRNKFSEINVSSALAHFISIALDDIHGSSISEISVI